MKSSPRQKVSALHSAALTSCLFNSRIVNVKIVEHYCHLVLHEISTIKLLFLPVPLLSKASTKTW